MKTIYSNTKKENLATPIGKQAPINTPEANNGTVFSKDIVPQNSEMSSGSAKFTPSEFDGQYSLGDGRAIDAMSLSRPNEPRRNNGGYGSVIYDLKGEDLARKQEIGTAKFSVSIDKDANNEYNLYTTTDDFVRQVPSAMRHDFTRSLANKTSGMTEGEIRTVYIYAGNVYAFRADGYMHGEVEEVFTPSEFKDIIATRKEYKNAIDADTKTADLWSKPISDTGRGSRSDISVLEGRGRPAPNDILSEDSSERYTARYTERERQDFETKEEADEIVRKLLEMLGVTPEELNKLAAKPSSDIAPVKTSSQDDAFSNGEGSNNGDAMSLSRPNEPRRNNGGRQIYGEDVRYQPTAQEDLAPVATPAAPSVNAAPMQAVYDYLHENTSRKRMKSGFIRSIIGRAKPLFFS